MPLFKFAAADDFEVVEVSGGRKDGITLTAEKASETEQVSLDEAHAQVDEIRREFEKLAKKADVRDVTNDRRMRTLECSFDDCEASVLSISRAVEQVKKQTACSAANQEALRALRLSLDDTRELVLNHSTWMDHTFIRHLPSVQRKLQDMKLEHGKQVEQTEAALRDLSERLSRVSPSEMTSIRRIAAEANLRALAVEQQLPELKSELFMAMAVEFGSAQEIAKSDRADAAREVDRLTREQTEMRENSRELALRVERTEEFAKHVTTSVVPLLEHRASQQRLLLNCKHAEIKEAANAAEAREALLKVRVQRLEEKLNRADGHAAENTRMSLRLAALEKAVEMLSVGSKASDVPQAPLVDEADRVERTLICSIKAEILRRSILAELGKRRRRMIAEKLSASAVRAGALLVALRGELRRRALRRSITAEAGRRAECFLPASIKVGNLIGFQEAVRAACSRRELRAAIAVRREASRHRAVPSASALKAACFRRELRVEITRRREELRRRRTPAVAALRAACFRREIRVEIARRLEVTSARAETARAARLEPGPKPARNGTVRVRCTSLLGGATQGVCVTVQVPTFVSVRYLKQLIYFKTGCALHPSNMTVFYGGRVLEDGWKVGGGTFTRPPPKSLALGAAYEFCGIPDNGTVLVADLRASSSATRAVL